MTDRDRHAWGTLTVVAAPSHGPRAMGFSRDLDVALATADLDLLHVHGLWRYTSVASRRWFDATARPYIVTPHGMLDRWAVRRHSCKKLIAALLFELAHLRGAVCLHARCEVEARTLRALRLRNPICVIPNAIELPPEPPAQGARIPLFDGAGEHLLLCLGPLARDGNARTLLHAWRRMRQRAPAAAAKWSLVVVGAADERSAVLKECAALAIENTVHVVVPADGCVPEALWQAASAALLLPAESEQIANALRAWSHARPVLLCGSAAALADVCGAAAIVVPSKIDDLAEALLMLLGTSPAERAAMGAAARRAIAPRLAPAAIAEQMASVYRWTLGCAPKPACIDEY